MENGLKTLFVGHLPEELRHEMERLHVADLSPDQYRLITKWLRKFLDGSEEHGRLYLRELGLQKVVGMLGEEMIDGTSYFLMILDLLEETVEKLDVGEGE